MLLLAATKLAKTVPHTKTDDKTEVERLYVCGELTSFMHPEEVEI